MGGEQDLLQQIKSASWKRAAAWIEGAASSTVSPSVLAGLRIASALIARLGELHIRHGATYKRLQIALGITPSSERTNASKGKGTDEPRKSKRKPVDPIVRLHHEAAEAERLADWHKKHVKKQTRKAKRVRGRLSELEAAAACAAASAAEADHDPLTEEDERELQQEQQAYRQRTCLGDGADPTLASPCEALMQGGFAQFREDEATCDLQPDELPRRAVVKRTFEEVRERIDFSFAVRQLNINITKYVVDKAGETTVVSGDITQYGPAKMKVTWNFLAHTALLVTQFAMPLHRLAKLVSTERKRFTSAEMARYYRFVAEHFAPIYIHLGKQLAQAPILSGDDTPSLVLSVARALAESKDAATVLPWKDFATVEQAKQAVARNNDAGLPAKLAQHFGFASSRKDGKGDKVGFNTSLLCGRAVADDPKSTIVFYRSHLGSLGNLLDAVLVHRDPNHRNLVLQTDLSTTNLISDRWVQKNFEITLAGCSSHARRPFAIYAQHDPTYCEPILHFFKGIPIYEHGINVRGRNQHNTLAVRGVDQRQCWEHIRDYCASMCKTWSRATPLGSGARYVLRHYDKLTYYLNDARLHPSNNYSERMLRQEKLIRNNSLFRASLSGRCALDIMRTITQTAMAAEVNIAAYLMWVMQMPRDTVQNEPAAFTPQAFGRWWAEQKAIDEAQAALAAAVQAATRTAAAG